MHSVTIRGHGVKCRTNTCTGERQHARFPATLCELRITVSSAATEYGPLLEAGIHSVSQVRLYGLAVAPFAKDARRAFLYGKFSVWVNDILSCGVGGTCWLDGSFLTDKPSPQDIDLVFFPLLLAVGQTPDQIAKFQRLTDRVFARAQYGLDLYIVPPGAANETMLRSYWRGWFGYCRDGKTAKGIAEVTM